MKLTLSKISTGARLGVISSLGRNGAQTLEVPGCLLYTKTGSPPHLTHDTLQTIDGVPSVTHITLSTLVEHQEVIEEYKEGIGKFAGMPDAILYCSLHDPVTPCPAGYNTNKVVSLWGTGGRLEMTPQKFVSAQRVLRADWFQCLSDGEVTPGGNSKKRIKKSVDRSLAFLDQCLQLLAKHEELKHCAVIGAVEGGEQLDERLRSARETAKRPVGGFLLDGFHGSSMDRDTKLSLISAVTDALPEDKPRLIHGMGRPDEVLDCVQKGVDLFDSCFPYQVTERGCALVFNHCYHLDPETTVVEKNEPSDGERNGDEREELDADDSEMTSFEICLKEKRFQEDFRPLIEGCACFSCRRHTRAYIHHLLTVKELLAGILLMIHNFQHYFNFFSSIRSALREGKLDVLAGIIRKQAS
ncbi:hypothetical protein GDO86_002622 [Hymenochirus boettgeri]|uniref:Queuine tRNA-ribosyltransferase accessory subunit 2 n=1 Tax=Hymenochirus boettgeri TaxID=247094 RepID=A0A8T2JXY7_9PIPI|nr:hypothetical protein GDO86_002622 [Hymenochirus boettgeri]